MTRRPHSLLNCTAIALAIAVLLACSPIAAQRPTSLLERAEPMTEADATRGFEADFCDDRRTVKARVVALDQHYFLNRSGASIPGGAIFALANDVVSSDDPSQSCYPDPAGQCEAGRVQLREGKRARPMVLRVNEGDCLQIEFSNMLAPSPGVMACSNDYEIPCTTDDECGTGNTCDTIQPSTRAASVHIQGVNWVDGDTDDGSFVGVNDDSLVTPGDSTEYTVYAIKEGPYFLYATGDDWTSYPGDPSHLGAPSGDGGWLQEGLFGSLNIEPSGYEAAREYLMDEGMAPMQIWQSEYYRSQVSEQDLCMASADGSGSPCTRGSGLPTLDYQAIYPPGHELAGFPILNMLCNENAAGEGACEYNEIVHSDLTGIITGPGAGRFPEAHSVAEEPPSLRPVYSYPQRLQPYREFSIHYHETYQVRQSFAQFFQDFPALKAAQDNFGINYGFGGLAPSVLANRLGVGPGSECVDCKYEEFFLTSWVLGDPAMIVDKHAEECLDPTSGQPLPDCRATVAKYPDDPSNVYHSYMSDHLKFRIHHAGPDLHHLHHQHAHQWLGSPNSPNADYLDSQSIGPGSSFTLEMVYEGSGNLNQTVGDSIFHCHFYPHFASGMWSLWRVHDTFEAGTQLDEYGRPVNECSNGATPDYSSDMPCGEGATLITTTRALPDGEIVAGAPTPALVPMPTLPMAPVPADVRLTDNGRIVEVDVGGTWVSSHTSTEPPDQSWEAQAEYKNPGYPYFIPGFAGERAPHPPMDFAWAYENCGDDYSYLNGSACTPPQFIPANRKEMMVQMRKNPLPEGSGCTCTEALDGGLPRHLVLSGVCDPADPSSEVGCGADYLLKTYLQLNSTEQANFLPFAQTDFSKEIINANAMQLPEGGTRVEKIAMAAHAQRFHYDSQLPDGTTCGTCSDNQAPCFADTPQGRVQCGNPYSSTCNALGAGACGPNDGRINFVLNGLDPISGAPYADPCIQYDRTGGEAPGGIDRDYLAADIQLDAVFNKEGWHFPQQRILSLWGDAQDFIDKKKPPEPLFMRVNSYDCMNYTLANLVPNVYELDDFQVRTPTDVIGQHIHLVKFDVTSSDGAANGWNYEDGTFAPNEVTERIHAINENDGIIGLDGNRRELDAKYIKFFGPGPGAEPDNLDTGAWLGSQATIQRWYDDPLYNNLGFCTTDLTRNCTLSENRPQWGMDVSCPDEGLCDPTAGFCIDTGERCTETNKSQCGAETSECVPLHDRTIRTVFTHDHYGPSTHQQAGLYAGVVAEPKDSKWLDNETGEAFGGYDATRCEIANPGDEPADGCQPECVWVTADGPAGRPAYCGVIPGRTVKANGVYLMDSGPTSWQAIIEPPILPGSCSIPEGESYGHCQLHPTRGCSTDQDCSPSYREFLLEFQDSALMYEPFYGPAFYPEVWNEVGKSQYANADPNTMDRPGVCKNHDDEPCGFCSYTGVCSGNKAIKCMIDAPGGSTVPDVCGNAGPCAFTYGTLTACTPLDLGECASNTVQAYIDAGLEESESCNFIAGVPATSWAFGQPIDAQGTGIAEGVTFNAATNNFSVNYRNEPLYGRTTEPATGAPLAGDAGDMSFAYQSIQRPNPRGKRCRDSTLEDCTSSGSCTSGLACQQAGFCSDNSALCVDGILQNCADPGTATCVVSDSATPYPETPLTAGIGPWDPFTPLMRTYAGDDIQVRTLVGAHINPHNFTMHGLNWLKEPSYVNSGWRNSEVMGISEHFEIIMRTDPAFAGGEDSADYLYQPGAAAIEQASGNWGILRSYNAEQDQLWPLPQNPPPAEGYDSVDVCPADAYERNYSVVALSAYQALGGPLVYNSDIDLQDPSALFYFRADDPNVKNAGGDSCAADPGSCASYDGDPQPLVLRAAAGDCINVTLYNNFNGLELACTDSTGSCDGEEYGAACGSGNCYYFLEGGQGYCSSAPKFTCTPATVVADCGANRTCQPVIGAGQASLQVKTGGPFPSRVTQTSNVSPNVGLRPQLVTYDLNTSDGSNGGDNPVQTVAPGSNRTYTWYAGHVEAHPAAGAMQHIPIEFGGSNLLPSDPMNHYRHALFGGLVIEPPDATWTGPDGGFDGIEAVVSYQRTTGAEDMEVMTEPAEFREFVIFMQDDLQSVQSTLGPQVNAINYSSPFLSTAWVGQNPSARYCGTKDETTDVVTIDQGNYDCVLSNSAFCCTDPSQCGQDGDWYTECGDPTPLVFEAYAGEEVRMRLLHPGGTNTANVFELYGHTWSEGPFETLPQWCDPPTTHTNLYAAQRQGDRNLCGSQEFWTSPAEMEAALMAEAREQFTRSEENNRQLMEEVEQSMRAFRELTTEGLWEQSLDEWRGSRMGHGPSNHFDVLIEEAGGRNNVPGDYLFRSFPAMHFNRGVWGIFRVKAPMTAESGESSEDAEAAAAAGAER